MNRRVLLFAALFAFMGAANARHAEESDPPPADPAALSKIVPGTDYASVVRALGPPNSIEKSADGEQQLIYTGTRRPLKQHVGFLFFGWTKESPGAPYRTVVTIKNNLVESVVSN